MDLVMGHIRRELAENSDPACLQSFQRFFKEPVQHHCVKVPVVRTIARKYWKEVSGRRNEEIFSLCEELYRSGYCEEAFIVSDWVPRLAAKFEPSDIEVFRHWIDRYITNWAMCDSFCNHAVGDFIVKYPEYIEELKRWTGSENRWMRRASAVSLIVPARRGCFLNDAIGIASMLLTDPDDMVQKGYGWLLKEASRQHREVVFAFVMENRKAMPRTALRYAIELMPQEMRAEAMRNV
jgi:3-methyladenine DNA glycosylase AlkD